MAKKSHDSAVNMGRRNDTDRTDYDSDNKSLAWSGTRMYYVYTPYRKLYPPNNFPNNTTDNPPDGPQ